VDLGGNEGQGYRRPRWQAGRRCHSRNISERKSLQEQLEKSEKYYKSLLQGSSDLILVADQSGAVRFASDSIQRLFGSSPDEALGQQILSLIHEDDVALVSERLSRAAEAPNLLTELRARRKDGTWCECEGSGRIITGPEGEPLLLINVRDITERKRAEREIALLAAIVESSDEAIISISPQFRIMTLNKGAQQMFGFTATEAIGKVYFELYVLREDREKVGEWMKEDLAAFRSDPAYVRRYEGRRLRKNGSSVEVSIVVSGIHLGGNVVGMSIILRDITERKRAERELREARDYTRGLIESSVDAMVIVDPDMRISDGNEQLAQLTELPKKVLFGSRFDSHFSEPAKARAAVEKALADGYVTNVDLTLRAASGREVLVSFNASLFYRAGKVFGIFGVARDVTVERATERTLRDEREYSRSLVQSSPDALLVSDSTLVLTDVNERALELTRYQREELLGSKLFSLFTEPPRALEVLEQARDTGPVHDIELFLLTRNAQEIPIALNASAFPRQRRR
jgi:PAS domain S-box-containing protein